MEARLRGWCEVASGVERQARRRDFGSRRIAGVLPVVQEGFSNFLGASRTRRQGCVELVAIEVAVALGSLGSWTRPVFWLSLACARAPAPGKE